MQETLEHYKKSEICRMADEQFSRLDTEDQQLFLLLKNSMPILKRLEEWYGGYKSIINFRTTKENSRTYFYFDIANPLVGSREFPKKLYTIKGSVIYGGQYKNIVYTICHGNGVLDSIYADNYTNIGRNVMLNELTYINTRANMSRVERVVLTVFDISKQDEKFIIGPDSDIYKLYLNRQIDIITLCNLALLQATNSNSKVIEEGKNSFTKLFDKRFI